MTAGTPGADPGAALAVVLDAVWWTRGPESNRQVMRSMVRTWLAEHPADAITLAVRAGDEETVRAEVGGGVRLLPLRSPVHGLAVALELPLVARRRRVPGVFVVHNFTPVAGRAVTFLHDVLFQEHPEWFTRRERLYFAAMPWLARRARAVVTSSRTEQGRIRRHNPRLAVVEAVGLTVHDDLVAARPERPALPGALDLDRGFFLTVARLNIRKNLQLVIDACDDPRVRALGLPVLVVGESSGRAAAASPAVARLEREGRVHFTGFVSTAQLRWLYANAAAFVCTSLDEGFGLPPVEAATFGCPVVVTDAPVFRETMGTAAAYVDPADAAQLAATMVDAVAGRTPKPAEVPATTWPAIVARLREIAAAAAERSAGEH